MRLQILLSFAVWMANIALSMASILPPISKDSNKTDHDVTCNLLTKGIFAKCRIEHTENAMIIYNDSNNVIAHIVMGHCRAVTENQTGESCSDIEGTNERVVICSNEIIPPCTPSFQNPNKPSKINDNEEQSGVFEPVESLDEIKQTAATASSSSIEREWVILNLPPSSLSSEEGSVSYNQGSNRNPSASPEIQNANPSNNQGKSDSFQSSESSPHVDEDHTPQRRSPQRFNPVFEAPDLKWPDSGSRENSLKDFGPKVNENEKDEDSEHFWFKRPSRVPRRSDSENREVISISSETERHLDAACTGITSGINDPICKDKSLPSINNLELPQVFWGLPAGTRIGPNNNEELPRFPSLSEVGKVTNNKPTMPTPQENLAGNNSHASVQQPQQENDQHLGEEENPNHRTQPIVEKPKDYLEEVRFETEKFSSSDSEESDQKDHSPIQAADFNDESANHYLPDVVENPTTSPHSGAHTELPGQNVEASDVIVNPSKGSTPTGEKENGNTGQTEDSLEHDDDKDDSINTNGQDTCPPKLVDDLDSHPGTPPISSEEIEKYEDSSVSDDSSAEEYSEDETEGLQPDDNMPGLIPLSVTIKPLMQQRKPVKDEEMVEQFAQEVILKNVKILLPRSLVESGKYTFKSLKIQSVEGIIVVPYSSD